MFNKYWKGEMLVVFGLKFWLKIFSKLCFLLMHYPLWAEDAVRGKGVKCGLLSILVDMSS